MVVSVVLKKTIQRYSFYLKLDRLRRVIFEAELLKNKSINVFAFIKRHSYSKINCYLIKGKNIMVKQRNNITSLFKVVARKTIYAIAGAAMGGVVGALSRAATGHSVKGGAITGAVAGAVAAATSSVIPGPDGLGVMVGTIFGSVSAAILTQDSGPAVVGGSAMASALMAKIVSAFCKEGSRYHL
jgi:hypothetical protein